MYHEESFFADGQTHHIVFRNGEMEAELQFKGERALSVVAAHGLAHIDDGSTADRDMEDIGHGDKADQHEAYAAEESVPFAFAMGFVFKASEVAVGKFGVFIGVGGTRHDFHVEGESLPVVSDIDGGLKPGGIGRKFVFMGQNLFGERDGSADIGEEREAFLVFIWRT